MRRLRQLFLFVGPFLLLLTCGVALAQDLASPGAVPSAQAGISLDYLLNLGPYGALVWGAYLLGKGVTIKVELGDRDRELLEKLAQRAAGGS